MHTVFLLIGSNLGDRSRQMELAKTALSNHIGQIKASSKIYESPPWGVTDQPAFLNQVVQMNTPCAPLALLQKTQSIEQSFGYTKTRKWGARKMDIDILFFDDLILNKPQLVVPHPQLHLRRFTLQPMVDIASNFQHPVLKNSMAELLKNCPDPNKACIFVDDETSLNSRRRQHWRW